MFAVHDKSEKRAKFEEKRTNAGVDKVTRAGPLFQQLIFHDLTKNTINYFPIFLTLPSVWTSASWRQNGKNKSTSILASFFLQGIH